MITIEQYLDAIKETSDKGLKEAENRPVSPDELMKLFMDSSSKLKANPDDLKNILTEIEHLFDSVPNSEIKSIFQDRFDDLSKLDGKGFKIWQESIKFDDSIKDDLKIGFLCSLYDLESMQWSLSAIKTCETDRQRKLIYLQSYQNLVEGFYSKTLNIFIYSMIKIEPSGYLKLQLPRWNKPKKIKSYLNVSKLNLYGKLLLMENDTKHKELSNIAKECNRELRNAVVHHEFWLDGTKDLIVYENSKMKFSDFIDSAQRLSDFCLIISLSLHYYSMKCYFKSKGFLS